MGVGYGVVRLLRIRSVFLVRLLYRNDEPVGAYLIIILLDDRHCRPASLFVRSFNLFKPSMFAHASSSLLRIYFAGIANYRT